MFQIPPSRNISPAVVQSAWSAVSLRILWVGALDPVHSSNLFDFRIHGYLRHDASNIACICSVYPTTNSPYREVFDIISLLLNKGNTLHELTLKLCSLLFVLFFMVVQLFIQIVIQLVNHRCCRSYPSAFWCLYTLTGWLRQDLIKTYSLCRLIVS